MGNYGRENLRSSSASLHRKIISIQVKWCVKFRVHAQAWTLNSKKLFESSRICLVAPRNTLNARKKYSKIKMFFLFSYDSQFPGATRQKIVLKQPLKQILVKPLLIRLVILRLWQLSVLPILAAFHFALFHFFL